MRTLLLAKLATFSLVILVSILAFANFVYAAPVPTSSDTASTGDNIYTDERPQPFVGTILSRRAKTLAKPEAEDGAFWHYRRHVKDKAEV
ncbi:hypothetical protein BKA57DRAFT_472177, partial [Linnemannia elongata]